LDCESNNIGRNGTSSQVTLEFAAIAGTLHHDVTLPGLILFKAFGKRGFNFGQVLENEHIAKLIWDACGDCNAIYHHTGVCLRGVIDLQVAKLACTGLEHMGECSEYKVPLSSRLPGLTKAVEEDLGLTAAEWL
ncbi:hypothetical protein BJ878DRAFT_414570, partial [Calycina marina]